MGDHNKNVSFIAFVRAEKCSGRLRILRRKSESKHSGVKHRTSSCRRNPEQKESREQRHQRQSKILHPKPQRIKPNSQTHSLSHFRAWVSSHLNLAVGNHFVRRRRDREKSDLPGSAMMVEREVAHKISCLPSTTKTSAAQIFKVLPERRTRPRAISNSPSAGAVRLILYSTVSTLESAGIVLKAAYPEALSAMEALSPAWKYPCCCVSSPRCRSRISRSPEPSAVSSAPRCFIRPWRAKLSATCLYVAMPTVGSTLAFIRCLDIDRTNK